MSQEADERLRQLKAKARRRSAGSAASEPMSSAPMFFGGAWRSAPPPTDALSLPRPEVFFSTAYSQKAGVSTSSRRRSRRLRLFVFEGGRPEARCLLELPSGADRKALCSLVQQRLGFKPASMHVGDALVLACDDLRENDELRCERYTSERDPGRPRPVRLKLRDQDTGAVCIIQVAQSTPFIDVFATFAAQMGEPLESLQCMFQGQRVPEAVSLADFGLADGGHLLASMQRAPAGYAAPRILRLAPYAES